MDPLTVKACIILTIIIEGGYAHLAGDNGAATQYGIASKFVPHNYDIKHKIKSKVIKGTLTLDEAIKYYEDLYVPSIFLKAKTPEVFFLLFDTKVHGYSAANMRILQKGLNMIGKKVKVDGKIHNDLVYALVNLTPKEYETFWKVTFDPDMIAHAGYYQYMISKNTAMKRKLNKGNLGWGVNGSINRIVQRAMGSKPGFIDTIKPLFNDPKTIHDHFKTIKLSLLNKQLITDTGKKLEAITFSKNLSASKNSSLSSNDVANGLKSARAYFNTSNSGVEVAKMEKQRDMIARNSTKSLLSDLYNLIKKYKINYKGAKYEQV